MFDDGKCRGIAAEVPGNDAFVSRRDFRARDITQPDRVSACVFDDDIAELLWRLKVGLREHRKFPRLAFDAPRRNFHILSAQCVFDVGRAEFVGREFGAIKPDAHRHLAFAEDAHVGGPRQR